jgi:hypothetical protein
MCKGTAKDREVPSAGSRREAIAGAAKSIAGKSRAQRQSWHPRYCGEIGMRIAADGIWYYHDSPIRRPALVKLFASVLEREGERYFLVTPVEKCAIAVEDAPFLAVEMRVELAPCKRDPTTSARVLRFRTNVDDWITCGADHQLRFEPQPGRGGPAPYLHVRANLWAKLTRALFYDLVELGEERDVEGVRMFGLASQGEFFAMAPAETLMELA